MVSLIYRDIILQKKLLYLFIPFVLFFILFWSSPFLMFTVAALYIPFNALYFDEKAETHLLLNSLPYKRWEIISARYLGTIIFTILSSIIVSIGLWWTNQTFTISDVIIGVSIFFAAVSFIFPLFHILKEGNITTIIIFGFIAIVGLVSITRNEFLSTNIDYIVINSNHSTPLHTGVIVITIILYSVSWFISYKLYNQKDF